MSLPALRLAFLRRWSCAENITAGLRELLVGKVLLLPEVLGETERDEIADLLALFLDLPVVVAARASDAESGRLYIDTAPVAEEPPAIAGSVRLCTRRHAPGDRYLDAPHAVVELRDAVIECIGRQHSGTRMQRVAAWTSEVTDTPSTALRFAGGALVHYLENPGAADADIYIAGLASVVAWLLRGLDARVAQWILARATRPLDPGRLVSTEAALLGQDAALVRAFEAGLIHTLPEEPGDPLDLRRPLEALGHLDDAPVEWPAEAEPLALIASVLKPLLEPEVHRVFDRLLRPRPAPLGLTGPRVSRNLIGRDEIIQRLATLFEPANEVRTTVLYGVEGIGKSQVAAALGERLGHRLEPIWVRFDEGPETGWMRVAIALNIDATNTGEREPSGVPRWVAKVHAALRARPCLLVVTGANSVTEDELPAWLPSGEGTCAVLVLSERSERPLQRRHDAIAVRLGALRLDESRRLLMTEVPKLREAIDHGEADRLLEQLGGHPLAIVLTAALLDREGLDEVSQIVAHGSDVIREVLDPLVGSLGKKEHLVLTGLAMCAPEGSPPSLPLRTMAVDEDGAAIFDRLADRSLVERGSRTVRLEAPVRVYLTRYLDEQPEARSNNELCHAQAAINLFDVAYEQRDSATKDELYGDILLATERMTARCMAGDQAAGRMLVDLASALRRYSRGNRQDNLERALAGYRAALTIFTKEQFPEEWAGTQVNLGLALVDLPTGERTDNLRQAIDAFNAALSVRTREEMPREWAATQNNLGNALASLPMGERTDNLHQAIDAYRAALSVHTRETMPRDWARTQSNLGSALASLPASNHADNLHQAIDAHRAALSVYTKEETPHDWAVIQYNLGAALARLPTGDSAENLRQAIDAYRAALSACTKEEMPREWAMTQSNLGAALAALPTGDSADNLRQAIDAYRAALSVCPKEEMPRVWAGTQNNLGVALAHLSTGDRADNLRQAIDAYRAALSVWTPEHFPEEHAGVQRNLEDALRALAEFEAAAAPPTRPKRPRRTKPTKPPS